MSETISTSRRDDTPSDVMFYLFMGVAIAVFACFDPYLSEFIPRSIWRWARLENFPFKLTLVFALAIAAVILFRKALRRAPELPYLSIALLFVFAQTGGLKAGPINLLDIMVLSVFIAFVADRLRNPTKPLLFPALFYFAVALLLLNTLNLFHQNIAAHIVGMAGLLKVIILAWVLVQLLDNEKSVRFAIRVFTAVAVVTAILGILQALLYLFAGIDFTFIEQFGGSDTQYKPTPLGMIPRSSALNATAQHMSGYLLLALPFLLFRSADVSGKRRQKTIYAILILLAGILTTWNYGAFFAAGFLFILYPCFRWPRYILHIILGLILFTLLLFYSGILEWIYDVSFGDAGVAKGVDQRQTLMLLGFDKLMRNPWLGEGLRGFANFSGNYWNRPVHNAYMQAATEIGIFGALVFVAMLITMLTQLVLAARITQPRWRNLLLPCALSMLTLAFLMISEPMLDHSNTWLLLGLSQSVLLVALREGPERRAVPRASSS